VFISVCYAAILWVAQLAVLRFRSTDSRALDGRRPVAAARRRHHQKQNDAAAFDHQHQRSASCLAPVIRGTMMISGAAAGLDDELHPRLALISALSRKVGDES
jgi:hypothetical protein